MSDSDGGDSGLEDDIDCESESSESESDNLEGSASLAHSFIVQLKQDLDVHPFSSELHFAFINAVRESADIDKLSQARRNAATKVALSESLWLEWLADESNLANEGELDELESLHQEACLACPLSSKIWLARCLLGRRRKQSQPEAVRALYEEALSVIGLHPTEGPEIWEDYREYEESLDSQGADGQASAKQMQRIRMLFLRQLVLPLPGIDRLREALLTFESNLDPNLQDKAIAAKAEALATAAGQAWRQRQELEQKLVEASRPLVMVAAAGGEDTALSPAQVMAELVGLEEKLGDANRVALSYLRATTLSPKDPELWMRHACFVSEQMGNHMQARNILCRAVLHCPSDAGLRQKLHVESELCKCPFEELQRIVNIGVEALLDAREDQAKGPPPPEAIELLLQHSDSCRRAAATADDIEKQSCWTAMRSAFARALSLAERRDTTEGRVNQVLLRWMRLEAYAAGDVKAVLEVGDRLMSSWGSFYNVWSGYLTAVRFCVGSCTDGYETLRKLYQRAADQVVDYPEQIKSDFVEFERERGTLSSMLQAQKDLRQLQDIHHGANSASAAPVAACAEIENKSEVTSADTQKGQLKREAKADKPPKPNKRQRGSKKAATSSCFHDPAEKQPVELETPSCSSALPSTGSGASGTLMQAQEQAVAQEPCTAAAAQTGSSEAQVAAIPEEQVPTSVLASSAAHPVESDETVANKKLTDLSEPQSSMQAPEVSASPCADQVRESCAEDTNMPAANQSTQDATSQSLSASKPCIRKDADSHETCQETETKAPHQGSHYHQQKLLQKGAPPPDPDKEGEQTVYVSCLDWSVDEPHLYRLFGDVGNLKDVRLVRDFLGRSKGYAYLDFESSAQVSKAVEALNGSVVNNRTIKVARSLPTKPLFEEKTVFVKGISLEVTEEAVRELFARQMEVISVRMPRDATSNAHRGYAYVELATAENMDSALKMDGETLGGQSLTIARSIPMKDHRHHTAAPRKDVPVHCNQKKVVDEMLAKQDPGRQAAKFPRTLYVKNLAFNVDEEKLKTHFEQCGEVRQVLLVRNATGKSRGFGFVEFSQESHAQGGLALSDSELCGRSIVVSRSQRAITQKKQVEPTTAATPAAAHETEELSVPSGSTKRRLDIGSEPEKSKKATISKPGVVQFRTLHEKQEDTEKDKASRSASNNEDSEVPAKPLSNADFRAFLFK